jgi:hypothetical protein
MHLDIPAIGQSYLLFRARLAPPFTFSAGGTPESLEARLFTPSEVPFSEVRRLSAGPAAPRPALKRIRPLRTSGTGHVPCASPPLAVPKKAPSPPPCRPAPPPQIAFSSVSIALQAYCEDMASGAASYRHGVIRKTPGSAPNDPASFELIDQFTMQLAP